jgi:hypothetical protein
MAQVSIVEFVINERAHDKLGAHGIDEAQLYAALRRSYVVLRNRKHRAASHLFIGRDDAGRCIVAPILPTDDLAVWRVVTRWYCKPSEADKLR